MANTGFSAPNDMIAILCERVDNGNNTYTVIPSAVAFGREENDMFYPEDNTEPLHNIEDYKSISNPDIKSFYVMARPIEDLIHYYNLTNLNMLALCYYTDVQKKIILALNEDGYIQVVSDDLDNFMGDIFVEQQLATKESELSLPTHQVKTLPSVITSPSGEIDLTHIDNFAMEKYLKERIFENDDIIEDICTTIAMNYSAKDPSQVEALLSIGPTGSGKSETYNLISQYLGVPLTIYDCTSLTAAGYVGKDIEDVLKKVYINSGGDKEKAEKSILVFDEFDKLAKRGSDVKDEQVQNALLKVLDGHKYTVSLEKNGGKSVELDTSFMTIAACGAFPDIFDKKKKASQPLGFSSGTNIKDENDMFTVTTEELVKFGMLAELIGRFDDPFVYKELNELDLRRILTESKNSFLLLKANRFLTQFNTQLIWDDTYLDAIIEEAIKKKTGGRSLKKTIAASLKKCDRELLSLRNQEGDKPRVLKLTADTVKNNRRFTIE